MNETAKAWNRGKVVGERLAFSVAEAQTIIRKLKALGMTHDACLFAVGIDSMLRSCDLLRLKVSDVAARDGAFFWRQRKTGKNVYPILTEHSQRALSQWIRESAKAPSDYVFTRTKAVNGPPISTAYFRRLIKQWAQLAGLPPEMYSTHSLRRTKPSFLYHYGYSDLEHIARLLGHSNTEATSRYLGIKKEEAHAQALSGDIFSADFTANRVGHPLIREFLKPDFLDQFAEALLCRVKRKTPDFIDENLRKGRE